MANTTSSTQLFDMHMRQSFQTIDLERLILGGSVRLDPRMLEQLVHNVRLAVVADHFSTHLIVRLDTYLWGRKHPYEVRTPATWWDHLKHTVKNSRWCPTRMAKWLHIRERVETVDAWEIWVNTPIPAPEQYSPTLRIAISTGTTFAN